MSTIDIRNEEGEEATEIVFAETQDSNGCTQANAVAKWPYEQNQVVIKDEDYRPQELTGYVVVSSKEHAQNLIKALEKAVDLGWLK